jgi:hypothetical protein
MTHRVWILFICLSTLMPALAAQVKTIYPHSVFWSKTEINEIFPGNVGVGLDFVYRRKNELGSGSMFDARLRESIRPWVHYQFSPLSRLSLSPIGYMATHDYIGKPSDYERPPTKEWRTTLQYFHHQKQAGGRLMHTWRYRYELRWQAPMDADAYRFFHRFRFRYRLRYAINSSDFYANNTIYAAVSNEIGLNFGRNVYLNTFNQNRLYLGLGMRVMQAARFEVRYVNRIRTRGATGFEMDLDRGLMLGLYIDQISKLGNKDFIQVRYFD